jgi:RHS repeat-associated protein
MPRSANQPFVRRLGASALVAVYLGQIAVAAPTRPQPEPPGGNGNGNGGGTPLPMLTKTTAPIALPGGGSVTDGGGAAYTLPIWVPAGPAGAQPSLSITYGGGGNGSLGVGFQLTGQSTITPCNKTHASEGFADNVDFGIGEFAEATFDDMTQDVYCLDGAKLVDHVAPGFVVPSSGYTRQYSTEHESYARIVAHRTDANSRQPDSFTVHLPTGEVRTYQPIYGHILTGAEHSQSRPEPSPHATALLYVMTEAVDRNGNKISYVYEDADSVDASEVSYRLDRIDYAFADPTHPRRWIELDYEDRPDPVIAFVRGIKLVNRSRLISLSMFAPNPTTIAKVMTYSLAYVESVETGRSLLDAVKMCDQYDQCSWVRSFDYTTRSPGALPWHVAGDAEFGPYALSYNQGALDRYHQDPNANWLEPTDVRILLYDIDGDGDDDALYRTGRSWISASFHYDVETGELYDKNWSAVAQGELKVRLSSEDMPLSLMGYEVSQQLEPWFRNATIDDGDVLSYANLGASRIADFDDDGRLDLMLARTQVTASGTTVDPLSDDATAIWRDDEWAYGFKLYPGKAFDHWAEYPYDVLQGLDTTLIHGPVLRYGTTFGSLTVVKPPFQRIVADLDGDSKVEIVDAIDGDIDSQDPPGINWGDPSSYFSVGQFDYHTTLSSDGSEQLFGANWTCGNGQALVIDQDGDGKQDVLVNGDVNSPEVELDPLVGGPTYRRLTLADPLVFGSPPPHGLPGVDGTSRLWGGGCTGPLPDLAMGDWNGDGLVDALYPPGSYNGNTTTLVRWNLGRGFGPVESIAISGAAGIAELMEQEVPEGKLHTQVAWDRGTRVADVNGDGRSDIIAFRQDNAACVDPVINAPIAPPIWSCENQLVAFISQGDHFAGEVLATWSKGGASLAQGFTLSQIGDVNGDGATDAVFVNDMKLNVVELPWRSLPDRLTQVDDTGSAYPLETFSYNRAWWGDKPRLEATAASPLGPAPCTGDTTCPRRGAPAVRQHLVFRGTRPDGSAMWSSTFHKYGSPHVDRLGRGSLGFGTHSIWDRERGRWTLRMFDNTVRVDPEDTIPGGIFYPYAGRVTSSVEITPRSPVPTDAELDDYADVGPGLTDSTLIDVRSRSSGTYHELRASAGGRILETLPTVTVEHDTETHAAPWISTWTPEYVAIAAGGGRKTTTTTEFDDYGNATKVTTELGDTIGAPTVTSERRTTYENRVATWQLRLPTRTLERSSDLDDPYQPGRVVRTLYDARGNAETIEANALGDPYPLCPPGDIHACELRSTVTTIVADARGNPTSTRVVAADTGEVRQTLVSWDADGVHPVTSTDPMGLTTTEVRHPALGVPVLVTDENGVVTSATYDGFGRLVASTRQGAISLTRTFSEITGLRRGLHIVDTHDDLSEEFRDTDELGRTIRGGKLGFGGAWTYASTSYDPYGNQIATSRPELTPTPVVWTTAEFDRLGQMLATTTPAGAVTAFERTIAEDITWDPEGHESYVLRDDAGRTVESGNRIAGLSVGAMAYQHGPFGQVERVVDSAGNAIELGYDAFGRLVHESDPDTGETAVRYDGFSQKVWEERANGDTFVYGYDLLGRPRMTTGPDGMTVRAYDTGVGAAGRPIEVLSPDGVVTDLTYDWLGRVHQLDQTLDGDTKSMTYRYDSVGRLLYAFYPEVPGFDRFTVAYAYGNGGHLASIRDKSTCNFSTTQGATDTPCAGTPLWRPTARDARLALTSATFGNGVTATRAYDPLTGLLTSLSAAGVTTTYHHDVEGKLERRTDTSTNRIEEFEYDELHRLTRWELTAPRERQDPNPVFTTTDYKYDDLGNLLRVETDGTMTYGATYGVAGSRPHVLASNSTGAFEHDKSGRQTDGGGRTITWTGLNQPRSITTSSQTRLFRYDGLGGRVTREDASGKILYLGRLYEHRDTIAMGQMDSFMVYGEPGLVAQVDYPASGPKKVHYVVGDPIDSATLVTDGSGAIEERVYYDPFGARVDVVGQPVADPVASTSFGFTGHEEDGAGLVNMQGRIYDRAQYRFLSPDAVVAAPLFGQAYNPYSYVLNNPLNYSDPTGFEPEPPCKYEDPYPKQNLNPGSRTEDTEYGQIIHVGTMVIREPTSVRACDQEPPPPPPENPALKNVVKGTPFQLPAPHLESVKANVRELFSSGRSVEDRARAATIILRDAQFAHIEAAGNMIIAMPQAPVLSFRAYEAHHQRALALEKIGAQDAANDEWMAMAQEGFLGVGETAGMATVFSPTSKLSTVARAENVGSLPTIVTRADEVHSALHPVAQWFRTTAVADTSLGRYVAGGAKHDLTLAQHAALRPGEIAAFGPGMHAETTILATVKHYGGKMVSLTANRPFCAGCRKAIVDSGGTILTDRLAYWYPRF